MKPQVLMQPQISPTTKIIGTSVTTLAFEEQIQLILLWAKMRLSKVVCVANVHMLMEAFWHPHFRQILESADLVTPDGMPLVRMIQILASPDQDRVAGMDLFLSLCKQSSAQNISVFFLGSDQHTLSLIHDKIRLEFPCLHVAGLRPLPFRAITQEEDISIINEVNDSGAGIVFVALGCPKQEKWIDSHRGKVDATMLGVGYVFEAYAGIKPRAPFWIQKLSLEWAYRLQQEPRRLWKRYALTIPPFLFLAGLQVLKHFIRKIFKNMSNIVFKSRYL